MKIQTLIQIFSNDFKVLKEEENFILCEILIESSSIQLPSKKELEDNLLFLKPEDSLSISIADGDEVSSFHSLSKNHDNFLNQVSKIKEYHDGELLNIKITIDKKNANLICIYNLSLFTSTLKGLTISQLLNALKKTTINKPYLIFESSELEAEIQTKSMLFSSDFSTVFKKDYDRAKILDQLKTTTFFSSIDDFPFTPDDFKVITEPSDSEIEELLNKLCQLFCIFYLFDISSIYNNSIEYKINGYKSIKGKQEVNEVDTKSLEDYYNIYSWVYSGGNINDKIGLARNIISLHFENSNSLKLTGHPFQSIQSSYKVYEKQNIKQYIEIRNKLTDQLLDFNNKANKLIENFASGFQKSALALVSFYISAIMIRVLSKGDMTNVFTIDVTILSIAFLFCSLIYFGMSRWEVIEQKKRFVQSYQNLKARYTDLLNEEDIDRILNYDKDYIEDLEFIDSKLKRYTQLWLLILGILSLATIILSAIYQLSKLSFVSLFINTLSKLL